MFYDSSRPELNTFENKVAKTINENHGMRPTIVTVQTMGPRKFSYATTTSLSVGNEQTYVSMRVGIVSRSTGTIRYSVITNT